MYDWVFLPLKYMVKIAFVMSQDTKRVIRSLKDKQYNYQKKNDKSATMIY